MKITMLGRDFNRIMNTCGPALEKGGAHQALEHIEFRCKGGVGVATACDLFALAQCRFEYTGDDGIFLMRRHRSVKNFEEITISTNGKKISVSDDQETTMRKDCGHTHPNWGKIIANHQSEEMRASIVLSASRLRRILDGFSGDDDAVTFEIRGDLDGVVMRGHDTFALLLPIRCEKNRKLAEFTRPEVAETKEGGQNGDH